MVLEYSVSELVDKEVSIQTEHLKIYILTQALVKCV